VSAILAVVTLGALLWQSSPVGPVGFARIRVGMTEREVAAILGGRPGYYADRDVTPLVADETVYELRKAGELRQWYGNRWWIVVCFDDQGRVNRKCINPCIASPETLWGRINAWLGSAVF